MRKDDPQINLRIPPDLKERIQQAAKENRRTQTAEIIARLEESFGPSPIDVSSDDLTTEERVELFRRQADAAAAAYHQVVRRLAQAEHILYQEIQMKER